MHWGLLIFGLLLAGSAAADPAPARQLYTRKCAACHQLYDPARYSAADWDRWLNKMQRKARLNDDQVEQLRSLHTPAPPP